MLTISLIKNSIDNFHKYLDTNLAAGLEHPAGQTSSFWAQHFEERDNYPTLNDFLSFRRGNFLYGVADTQDTSIKLKAEEFESFSKSTQLFTPIVFTEGLTEPPFGAPYLFPFGKTYLSAAYVWNSSTTWRIKELLSTHAIGGAINVLEIGAGMGICASQLHQVCDVNSYTVIDLPENLCLSSVFLSTTLPSRIVNFIECDKSSHNFEMLSSSLNFGLPAAIDHLAGDFDLILNSFSFQEMNKLSVETYMDWASKALKKDGILVSFNSHGKAGVQRPADYLRPGFCLVGMSPFRSLPPGFFNTIPYEMVFKKTEINGEKIDHEVSVNAIGELTQLGLDNDLRPLISKFLAHDGNTSNILSLISGIFYNESLHNKNVGLNELVKKYPSALSSYLYGNYFFVLNDFENARKCLNESIALGLSNFAGVRARVMLALISRSRGESGAETLKRFKIDALETTGGLTKEIENIIIDFNIDRLTEQIARIMSIKPNKLIRIKTRLLRFRYECLSFLRVSFSKTIRN
jgi:hypothetical protein